MVSDTTCVRFGLLQARLQDRQRLCWHAGLTFGVRGVGRRERGDFGVRGGDCGDNSPLACLWNGDAVLGESLGGEEGLAGSPEASSAGPCAAPWCGAGASSMTT